MLTVNMIIVFGGIVLLHLTEILCQKISIKQFCNVKCLKPSETHTICEFKCKEDKDRCKDFKFYPLSKNERQILLDQHNMYRNKVASGEERRGGCEPAKDMKVLNYDLDIEVTTYCWGKRCLFAHDRCRNLPKYDSAGQNLFLQAGSLPIDGKNDKLLNTSITEWYEEITHSTKELIGSFGKTQAVIGHFTQVIWAKTEFIACSRVTWTDDSEPSFKFKYHLICNYSPAGNFLQNPVYEFGQGCTSPEGPNDRYKSLCGTSIPIREQNTIPMVENHGNEPGQSVTNTPMISSSDIRLSEITPLLPLIFFVAGLLR